MFSLRRFFRAAKALGEDEKNPFPVDVRRVDLRDGDIFIIRCTTDVSTDRMSGILDVWNKQFPGVKALIVDQYLDVSIVSKFPAVRRPEARQ
jgi:hypothetical protein